MQRRDDKVKRALITGATGFVGRALAARLLADGWSVAALARDPARLDAGIEGIVADLAQPETLRVEQAYDVVFHLAAQLPAVGITDSDFAARNAQATAALLAAAKQAGAGRFVYMSSISVIGGPEMLPVDEDHPVAPGNAYSASKLAGEDACRAAHADGASVVSLRLTSPYGPGMAGGTVLPIFVALALSGEPLTWHGGGSRAQDFIHIGDVVQGVMAAATASAPGPLYNLASGSATTMRTLAETIAGLTGGRAGASGAPDPQDGVRWDIDIARARAELGFTPGTSLVAGLTDYIAAERAR
jgi:UDP-glucose 4-epimerase